MYSLSSVFRAAVLRKIHLWNLQTETAYLKWKKTNVFFFYIDDCNFEYYIFLPISIFLHLGCTKTEMEPKQQKGAKLLCIRMNWGK